MGGRASGPLPAWPTVIWRAFCMSNFELWRENRNARWETGCVLSQPPPQHTQTHKNTHTHHFFSAFLFPSVTSSLISHIGKYTQMAFDIVLYLSLQTHTYLQTYTWTAYNTCTSTSFSFLRAQVRSRKWSYITREHSLNPFSLKWAYEKEPWGWEIGLFHLAEVVRMHRYFFSVCASMSHR